MDNATEPLLTVVVDDDPFARDAMCQMLESAAIRPIPVTGSDEECLDVIERNQPRVLITDLHSSDDVDSGTSLVRRARALSPITACLVLVTSDPTGTLLSGALLAGAQGCIRKGAVPPQGLPALVRRLAAGEYVIDPLLAAEPRRQAAATRRWWAVAGQSSHFTEQTRRRMPSRKAYDHSPQLGADGTQMQEEMAPWPTKNTLA